MDYQSLNKPYWIVWGLYQSLNFPNVSLAESLWNSEAKRILFSISERLRTENV